ncbi:hypothetical protein [Limnohabitans sp. 15K]|uniref:hypothetical protein n=1 Tax=Limnohabitans sp. 15K TaxID=1100706 RepID=UPI00117B5F16|nr:hypothetical protein [Limnohabitans sp. 15K]
MRDRMGLPCSQSSASFTTGAVTVTGVALSAAMLSGDFVSGAVVSTACSGNTGSVFSAALLEA